MISVSMGVVDIVCADGVGTAHWHWSLQDQDFDHLVRCGLGAIYRNDAASPLASLPPLMLSAVEKALIAKGWADINDNGILCATGLGRCIAELHRNWDRPDPSRGCLTG